MTESEWQAADHRRYMMEHLGQSATDRKLRLFAVACARRTAPLWGDDRPLALLEAAERLADGFPTRSRYVYGCGVGAGMHFVYEAATATLARRAEDAAAECPARAAVSLAYDASEPFPYPKRLRVYIETGRREGATQAGLLRDVFGNPFRPVTFDPEWRTDTAVSLARGMYESRDFGAMPILADALQDAGCEEDVILEHCRGDGPHVRGCWVVDLILGKE